jgi:hypothetical protein
MTKTTGKRDHGPALVAALTLLGASLGVSAPADAATGSEPTKMIGDTGNQQKGEATSTQHKGGATSNQYKEHAPSARFIKIELPPGSDEATSNQHKGQAPSAMFLKHNVTGSNQIKGETTSTQHKGEAPSAMFLKHNVAGSNQIKGETTSTQHKTEIKSNQIKLKPAGETH